MRNISVATTFCPQSTTLRISIVFITTFTSSPTYNSYSSNILHGISTGTLTPSLLVSIIALCIVAVFTIPILIILALKHGLFNRLIWACYPSISYGFPEEGLRVPSVRLTIPTYRSKSYNRRQ
ncbi:hypothetical protein XELAEV_18023047mg [Xenopus laevis]|uniref:Uncharacterized protein n=1 Tax=Xenopus laevis TaxID=8355 RepID=A0A974HP85_XENLA|nr:hypothetical protein XELAEV_18023047mg [Xenopus laevis]